MAAVTQRTFGVEIECGSDKHSPLTLRNFIRSKGTKTQKRWAPSDNDYAIHSDGSGIELSGPVLKGEAGFKSLKSIMYLLRKERCWVSDADGMHVHHGAPEFVSDWDMTKKLVTAWARNEDAIYQLVAPRRTSRGTWKRRQPPRNQYPGSELTQRERENIRRAYDPIYALELRQKEGHSPGAGFGRNVLNIASLQEHGTFEFRAHQGTLDFDTARAWIEFGQRFIEYVVQGEENRWYCKSAASLCARLEVPKEQAEILQRRGRNDPTYRARLYR